MLEHEHISVFYQAKITLKAGESLQKAKERWLDEQQKLNSTGDATISECSALKISPQSRYTANMSPPSLLLLLGEFGIDLEPEIETFFIPRGGGLSMGIKDLASKVKQTILKWD
ncbi:sugar phosphate permease [Platysternon megacephalum]|uniref:Sugar phosphate permease n=1 Tax=Platysternon megacephalum TaxID=55544 RepID=A0A4D9DPN8_9SAUR|nr:sugar phosphate permease [Platysternon megacephalum]